MIREITVAEAEELLLGLEGYHQYSQHEGGELRKYSARELLFAGRMSLDGVELRVIEE